MTQNFMDNYVDVATRLKIAFERWPDMRIQETSREVIEMPDKSCFIRCTVTIYIRGVRRTRSSVNLRSVTHRRLVGRLLTLVLALIRRWRRVTK